MENVLDSMVTALLADKNRKFIYVEQVILFCLVFFSRPLSGWLLRKPKRKFLNSMSVVFPCCGTAVTKPSKCFNEWEMRKVNQLSESTMYRAHLSRGFCYLGSQIMRKI